MWVTCHHQLAVEEGRDMCHYVKNKESQLVVGNIEYVVDVSLITLHGENIKESDKQKNTYKHGI